MVFSLPEPEVPAQYVNSWRVPLSRALLRFLPPGRHLKEILEEAGMNRKWAQVRHHNPKAMTLPDLAHLALAFNVSVPTMLTALLAEYQIPVPARPRKIDLSNPDPVPVPLMGSWGHAKNRDRARKLLANGTIPRRTLKKTKLSSTRRRPRKSRV
jgi:hypothetical protein